MNDTLTSWSDIAARASLELQSLSIQAGKAILEVYQSEDFNEIAKGDGSPLTAADLASQQCIISGLNSLEGPLAEIPILSEEGDHIDYSMRKTWQAWWLIDPLDGTKEFVKRNGEFTVNIALIVRTKPEAPGIPVAGWVYAPVLDRLYQGLLGRGALRIDGATTNPNTSATPLPSSKQSVQNPRVVASRSHRSPETDLVIEAVARTHGRGELTSAGSSLKLCLVAEGSAELYPRPAPTMEWDTGAADAVCRAAGKQVIQALNGNPLIYGKENLLNPWFAVAGDSELLQLVVETLKTHQDNNT